MSKNGIITTFFAGVSNILARAYITAAKGWAPERQALLVGASATLVIFDTMAFYLGTLFVISSTIVGGAAAGLHAETFGLALLAGGLGAVMSLIASAFLALLGWLVVKGLLIGFIFKSEVGIFRALARGIIVSSADVAFFAFAAIVTVATGGIAAVIVLPLTFLARVAWYALIVPPVVKATE